MDAIRIMDRLKIGSRTFEVRLVDHHHGVVILRTIDGMTPSGTVTASLIDVVRYVERHGA